MDEASTGTSLTKKKNQCEDKVESAPSKDDARVVQKGILGRQMISPEDAEGKRFIFRSLDYEPLVDSSNMTRLHGQGVSKGCFRNGKRCGLDVLLKMHQSSIKSVAVGFEPLDCSFCLSSSCRRWRCQRRRQIYFDRQVASRSAKAGYTLPSTM
jgi:hypothetical protein